MAARPENRRTLPALTPPAGAELDARASEVDRVAGELDDAASTWEHRGPDASAAALYALEGRMSLATRGGVLDSDWHALRARALVMLAQAELDLGHHELAEIATQRATSLARAVGDGALEAHAAAIAADVYAQALPRGNEPVGMFQRAAALAPRSAPAVVAKVSEALARATRGDGAAEVVKVLAAAEAVQGKLPASSAWPRWTPAHLHAFGGCALVRCGELALAAEWLASAAPEAAPMPGLATAVRLYEARRNAAAGDWDAAYEWAEGTVAASGGRGVLPGWLVGGVTSLASEAAGRGGDWVYLREAVSAN
jgi:hypothetical protein